MQTQLPLATLIQARMDELGLDREGLGFRLGYLNPLKASGRVGALCSGHLKAAERRSLAGAAG